MQPSSNTTRHFFTHSSTFISLSISSHSIFLEARAAFPARYSAKTQQLPAPSRANVSAQRQEKQRPNGNVYQQPWALLLLATSVPGIIQLYYKVELHDQSCGEFKPPPPAPKSVKLQSMFFVTESVHSGYLQSIPPRATATLYNMPDGIPSSFSRHYTVQRA